MAPEEYQTKPFLPRVILPDPGEAVSSQPHSLRGEAAQWVDDRLEEECQRGQLIRGLSAWRSGPFPTKEMPSHKRFRKRRLVVDYRRVNARVKRSTYYCRRSTDVLAAAVGSVWYTFVDAVSGFNQIRNTKRAREVLAIVARSRKYLPVGLTFGPVNGPDDFNFVVDRAFSPDKGRKLRFTKVWVAYVDDLTVRTGRVIDGCFMTDAEAEREIRQACAKGALAVPQGAGSALEALGVNTNLKGTGKTKHNEATSDHSHPTRSCGVGGLGDRQVVCSVVVFAALVAAPVVLMRTRLFLARKVFMLTVFKLLSMLSLHLSRSAVHVFELEHESLQSHVLPALSTASHLCVPQRQRARDSGPQCSLVPFSVRIPSAEWDLRFASYSRRGEHSTQLSYKCAQPTRCRAGLCVSPVPPATGRWARDTEDLEKALVKAPRHGTFGLRGRLEVGGWVRPRVVADRLNVTVERIKAAIDARRRQRRA